MAERIGDPKQLITLYREKSVGAAGAAQSEALGRAVDKRIDAVISFGKLSRLGSIKLDAIASALHMTLVSSSKRWSPEARRDESTRLHLPRRNSDDDRACASDACDDTPRRHMRGSFDDSVLPDRYWDLNQRAGRVRGGSAP
jgi:hypothetical protein